MTFLSVPQLQAKLALKLKMSSKKIITSVWAISTLSMLSVFSSSTAFANSCSKSDIDYYLQRGFTNAQVVQLCAGPAAAQNTGQQTQTYQAPAAQTQQSQQQNQIREDESYLSAALDASAVNITNQSLTIQPRECIEYGSSKGGQAASDLAATICVNTKVKVNFSGMTIGKTSRGFFLVKDPTVSVRGNIQREFVGIKDLRRQDREAILETLSRNPKVVKIKIRRGIEPSAVAQRLSKYTK